MCQFLGPEIVKMGQHSFWPQKLTSWVSFWAHKLTLWARDTLCQILTNPETQQPLTSIARLLAKQVKEVAVKVKTFWTLKAFKTFWTLSTKRKERCTLYWQSFDDWVFIQHYSNTGIWFSSFSAFKINSKVLSILVVYQKSPATQP